MQGFISRSHERMRHMGLKAEERHVQELHRVERMRLFGTACGGNVLDERLPRSPRKTADPYAGRFRQLTFCCAHMPCMCVCIRELVYVSVYKNYTPARKFKCLYNTDTYTCAYAHITYINAYTSILRYFAISIQCTITTLKVQSLVTFIMLY